MSHAHHFLERLDRVTREQTEFALSLYRDHEGVAYVLSHVRLPEGATRVALSIDDPTEGPFVVVTRDGRFVTCLGKGMHHDLPVVPRGQLDAHLAKVAEKRARREIAAQERRPDEEHDQLFQRVVTRGSRFAREDFVALSSFEPLLGFGAWQAMLELAIDALKSRELMTVHARQAVVNGRTSKALERHDRIEWSVAHLAVLTGAADRRELDGFSDLPKVPSGSPTFGCAVQGGLTFYLRAAWLAARFGKVVLPQYKAAFLGAVEWMSALDAAVGLGAIGLRHTGTLAEVKRFLEGFGPAVTTPKDMNDVRSNMASVVLANIAHADECLETGLKIGRDFSVTYGASLPEGHPRRYSVESVPDDIARAAILGFDGDMFDPQVQALVFHMMPTAARCAAEDFYLPREVVRAWKGAWSAEETLERLQRFARVETRQKTVHAAAAPGRNDPCACGSGKKYKKCHGA